MECGNNCQGHNTGDCNKVEEKPSIDVKQGEKGLPGQLQDNEYLYMAENSTKKNKPDVLPEGVNTSMNVVSNYAESIKDEVASNSYGIDQTRTSVRDLGEIYNEKMWQETRLQDGHPDERSVTYSFGVALGKVLKEKTGGKPREGDPVKLAHAVLETNGAAGASHEDQQALMKQGAMNSEQVINELNGE